MMESNGKENEWDLKKQISVQIYFMARHGLKPKTPHCGVTEIGKPLKACSIGKTLSGPDVLVDNRRPVSQTVPSMAWWWPQSWAVRSYSRRILELLEEFPSQPPKVKFTYNNDQNREMQVHICNRRPNYSYF